MVCVRRRATALAIAATVAALLAGCTGADATPSPTTAPTSTGPASRTPAAAEPSPTAPATSAAADPADPSTWLVAFDGIGPMKAGAPLATVPDELRAFTQLSAPEEQCTAYVHELDPDLKAANVATRQDAEHVARTSVSWMGSARAPGAADVARSPRTERGIGIGSTLEELREAYPELVVTHLSDVPTYGVGDGERWILFRDLWAEGTVTVIQVGTGTLIANEIC